MRKMLFELNNISARPQQLTAGFAFSLEVWSIYVSLKRLFYELLNHDLLMKYMDAMVTKWFTLTLYDDKWWQLSEIKSNCSDVVTNILTTFNLQCNQFRKIMTPLMIQTNLFNCHKASYKHLFLLLEQYIPWKIENDKQFGSSNLSGMSQCHQPAGGGTKVLFKNNRRHVYKGKCSPGPRLSGELRRAFTAYN